MIAEPRSKRRGLGREAVELMMAFAVHTLVGTPADPTLPYVMLAGRVWRLHACAGGCRCRPWHSASQRCCVLFGGACFCGSEMPPCRACAGAWVPLLAAGPAGFLASSFRTADGIWVNMLVCATADAVNGPCCCWQACMRQAMVYRLAACAQHASCRLSPLLHKVFG